MFKRWYIVRYGTASVSRPTQTLCIKAYSRKNAYKRVKKTLPNGFLVTDIIRVYSKAFKPISMYEPDKRYDI